MSVEFKTWFQEKFKRTGFPDKEHIDFSTFTMKKGKNWDVFKGFDVIINVSDFSSLNYSICCQGDYKSYHWFPMNEKTNDIGINSIFAALTILYDVFKQNKSVLVHCYNGSNRSAIIEACFYKMMTGEDIDISFIKEGLSFKNRIQYNSFKGFLPSMDIINFFLEHCKYSFENPHAETRLGLLDFIKKKSNLI